MLINVKLNDTVHKMLWEESVHMCIRNIMATTGSTRSPFGDLYGEKPMITGLFSDFGRIRYITKREKFEKHMID